MAFVVSLENPLAVCPNLMIIDLNLPRRSGREVLELMRRGARCRTVPVVVLSSSDAAQDKEAATRLGASKYISKPSRLDEFLAIGAILRDLC